MNKVFIKVCQLILSTLVLITLSGCQPNDYTEEGALTQIQKYYKNFKDTEEYKQFREAWNLVKQTKILIAKMNQSTIVRAVKYDFLLNGKLPANKEELENLMDKPLAEMRLDAKFNPNGTIELISTDPELTKDDVPNVIIDTKNF